MYGVISGSEVMVLVGSRMDTQWYLLGYTDTVPGMILEEVIPVIHDWIQKMAFLTDWRINKTFPTFKPRYHALVEAGVLPPLDHAYKEEWRKFVRDMPYQDYLQTPYWKARRKEALEDYNYRCARCGTGGRLQVHHLTYKRLGVEQDRDLIVLCQDCHQQEHQKEKTP